MFEVLSAQLPVELLPVLHWFEDNYMGPLAQHGPRYPALFPVDLWSVNERVLNDEHCNEACSLQPQNNCSCRVGHESPNDFEIYYSFKEGAERS